MFFLVLCKLFLWSRCQYISVVDAQPGDQSPKPEEYQLGIKQCEERCLDTGECRGFSYDSFALRCSLTFEEDNFQYKSTTRKCGTSFCKGGERCLSTRKSHYACVSYVAQEEEHLPEKEVKLDLEDLGPLKIHHNNFYGCGTTRTGREKMKYYMFLLSVNKLIATDTDSLKSSYTWPIVNNSNLKPLGLTNGVTKLSKRECIIYIMVSSSTNDHTWLVSITERKLFKMKTIDLNKGKDVKAMTKSNHYQLSLYALRLYLISTRPGRHHELSIALLESKDTSYELKQLFSINTGFVRVTDKPVNLFFHDKYVFVLVKNVLLRWRMKNKVRKVLELRSASLRMYRWDSPRNTICSAVHYVNGALYTIDRDDHLRKAQLRKLGKCLDN